MKTRPDIAFAVNRCTRFMNNPSKLHFIALDRVWKYLLYTEEKTMIFLIKKNNLLLLDYSDADWGGDLVDRKSTIGNIFYYGNNPIS